MLLQQIDHWAELAPQRLAHKNRLQVLTYDDLKTFSDILACWLYQRVSQLEKRSPIIVYGHKESEMLVFFLACLKAGHPYIPIDKSIPTERLLKIIASSGAAAILSPTSLPEKAKMKGILYQEDLHLPFLNLAPLNSKPESEWKIGLDEVWYIIYTSGSTGEPKGVQITQRSLLNFITWVNTQYRPKQQEEVFLNQAPFSFDLSVMDLYMALSTGGTLWSIDKEHINSPKDLFDSLQTSQISYWISTPSFAEMCLMDPNFKDKLMPKLRYFLFCGEVLPPNAAANLIELFPETQVVNLYGPTECTVAVTGVIITKEILQNSGPLPVGQDSANCQIFICDPDDLNRTSTHGDFLAPLLKSVPTGVCGEIVIVGPNVSKGYLNRPELTKCSFFMWKEHGVCFQGYRTGDLGYWLDGKLYYLGRQDFQIKLHGYRIELGEIEEQLRKMPSIENAIVVPIVRRGKNAALQAFIKLCHDFQSFNQERESSFKAELEQQIRQRLERVLPVYMLPQRYSFIDSLPMTANGKVDRKALLQGG